MPAVCEPFGPGLYRITLTNDRGRAVFYTQRRLSPAQVHRIKSVADLQMLLT